MKPGNDLACGALSVYLGDERLAPGLGNLPDTPTLSSFVSSDKVIVCSRARALADVEWLGRGRPRVLQSVDVI